MLPPHVTELPSGISARIARFASSAAAKYTPFMFLASSFLITDAASFG